MLYFVKTPWWLKKLYGDCVWEIPTADKIIYLSFDDGPHPEATPFVLDTLRQYEAKASFFCIGKNVVEHPAIYERILREGHAVGNHTFNHLDGWKTPDREYLNNIQKAKQYIDSALFRPPYGKASQFQLKLLQGHPYRLTPIMWTVLSGDFDPECSNEKCLRNVLNNTGKGSIVVFHDSAKAYPGLSYALPKMLEYFAEKGYRFEKINAVNW